MGSGRTRADGWPGKGRSGLGASGAAEGGWVQQSVREAERVNVAVTLRFSANR